MRIAVLFGGMCLSFRGSLDFEQLWTDPRGLTGSELGAVRIAEELAKLGHDVTLRTVSADTAWHGVKIERIDSPMGEFDLVIAINEPELLRGITGPYRVCMYWLNDASFNKVGFSEWVDLFCSPSAAHMRQMFENAEWHKVEKTPEHPDGKAKYIPEQAAWEVVELGCDPERYEPTEKIPGRVIYTSSPDRGLHWLLQEWPAIKRAAPHATLHIFYRLEPWLRGFDQTPYFPPIEPLRERAQYIEECLTRFRELDGLGVTLRDSVSRETIEREMSRAEVLAYPCCTTTWSEGFSCSVLECCAAGTAPIITDCDALGEIYAELEPTERMHGVEPVGNWVPFWRDRVIRALTDEAFRTDMSRRARALAERLTWQKTAARIVELASTRSDRLSSLLPTPASKAEPEASTTSSTAESPEASPSSTPTPARKEHRISTERIRTPSTLSEASFTTTSEPSVRTKSRRAKRS